MWSVDICHGCEIALSTVAVFLIGLSRPVVPVLGPSSLAAYATISVWIIIYGVQGFSRLSTEYREPFLSAFHLAVGVAPVLGVVNRLDGSVGSRLADEVAAAVLASRCRFAYHLCLTVAVEVIDEELGVVCSSPDVHSEIDAP